MPKNNKGNRRSNNNNPEGYNQFSGSWMNSARERPIAAAGLAAAAVGASVFLWSRRSQISEQLSNISDQIGEMGSGGGSDDYEMADSGSSGSSMAGGSSGSWSGGSSSGSSSGSGGSSSGGSSGEFMGSGASGATGSGMSGGTGMGSSTGSTGGKSGKSGGGVSGSSAGGTNRSRS